MASLGSYSTGTSATTTLSITKPTGLQVGDLLVAAISSRSATTSTPSGWTLELSDKSTNSSNTLYVYYKVADSGDVAASVFDWTISGANSHVGAVYRITGFFASDIICGSGSDTRNGAQNSYNVDVAPAYPNSLMMAFINYDTTVTMTAYSVVTNNPSFVEIHETMNGASNGISAASATRPETTNTGDLTITKSGDSDTAAILIAVSTTENGTGTIGLLQSNTTLFNVVGTSGTAGTLNLLNPATELLDLNGATDRTAWANQSKNSTTWINQSKS